MFFSRIALHTLVNNRRQYVSLFSVCLAGITIMLSALWVTDGMLKAVHNKSKQYYGGDITLMGGDISYSLGDTDSLIQTLKGFLPEDVTYYSRIDYDARKSYIFFEGMTVRQRMAKGVDFEAERDLFSAFDFVEGNAEPSEDHNNILRHDLGLTIDKNALAVTHQSAQFGFTREIQFPYLLAGDA